MTHKPRRFLFDVESTGTVELRTAGADAYWSHPDTRIIWLCYRIDDGPVIRWRPGGSIPYFVPDMAHPSPPGWRIVAHNYLFEYACWKHHLWPRHGWAMPPSDAWDCTMARALYWGLPAALGDACDALALEAEKDASARPLMLRMAKPRNVNATTGAIEWWHETDPDKTAALGAYCEKDVLAECALDDALPLLPPTERRVFLMDGEINRRGVAIDLDAVRRLDGVTEQERTRLNARMSYLTNGRARTANQVTVIRSELAGLGCCVPSLTKEAVQTALAMPALAPLARDILMVRQEAAKASTGKLTAMLAGVSPDGRCRGLLQYGGAGRTLRWAGRRVQPQNYPRAKIAGVDTLFRLLKQAVPWDEIAVMLPGSTMDAVSAMLRGCMVPSRGRLFVSGDLSQIEARVLAWLAGQRDVLAVFGSDRDVYLYTASKLGSNDRQFGKVLVLACGFGMGAARFQETAAVYGVVLSLHQAEAAVLRWRDTNSSIVRLWWDVDRAFRAAARGAHGTLITVGRFLAVRRTRAAVRIRLPSVDHEIVYHGVELLPDGAGHEEITYLGVHPKTKRWTRIRTYGARLVENIVQAVARDVMAAAMLRQESRGRVPVLTVHDELLSEAPAAYASDYLLDLLTDLRTAPAWAPGLPVNAEGWIGERFRK